MCWTTKRIWVLCCFVPGCWNFHTAKYLWQIVLKHNSIFILRECLGRRYLRKTGDLTVGKIIEIHDYLLATYQSKSGISRISECIVCQEIWHILCVENSTENYVNYGKNLVCWRCNIFGLCGHQAKVQQLGHSIYAKTYLSTPLRWGDHYWNRLSSTRCLETA